LGLGSLEPTGRLAVLAKLRSRLTYANVVATLALFLALGAGSYAAVTITGKNVKNSSLTGRDVKNNSLTGADVKNITSGDVSDGSLLSKDFKAGQLPAGPRGLQGTTGATGPSHTYAALDRAGGDGFRQISVRVPGGDYLVTAKAELTNTGSTVNITCQLAPGSASADLDSSTVTLAASQQAVVPNHSFAHLPNGGSITESCNSSSVLGITTDELRLSATRVGTLTVQPNF
jgi:hypothetical protein